MIESKAISGLGSIRHGFFTREGGTSTDLYESLNCGYGSNDDPVRVSDNRQQVAAQLGTPPTNLVTAHQAHTGTPVMVTEPWAPDDAPVADGLVTREPGIALGILTADCVPVLFAEPYARIIGAAHAGWRGAVAGIVEATIAGMEILGADRQHISAAIGPSISQPCYEVGSDLHTQITEADDSDRAFFMPGERDDHWMFDLPGYVAERLSRANIALFERLTPCTYSDEVRFFSYRRATHRGEADYGRQISAIVMVPETV